MQRRLLWVGLFLAALAIGSLTGIPASGADPKVATKADSSPKKAAKGGNPVVQLMKKLDQPLVRELQEKGIEANTPFKDALEFISDKHDVLFVIDTAAFKEENPELEIEATTVRLAKMKGANLGTALRLLVSQLPTPATYLIRRGSLEITTKKEALTDRLVQQQVTAKFDKVPLDEAVEELAELTGASVIVDGRVADKAKTPVSATFKNNMSLEAAVSLLANMADLKAVVIESGVYVTTKENAAVLEAEQKQKKPRVFERKEAKAVAAQ